jgi:hypothetical protein
MLNEVPQTLHQPQVDLIEEVIRLWKNNYEQNQNLQEKLKILQVLISYMAVVSKIYFFFDDPNHAASNYKIRDRCQVQTGSYPSTS